MSQPSAFARRQYSATTGNLTARIAPDAARLPFAEGSFDAVIANHMLYHLDDPIAALREFARVVAPGGRVAIALNGRDHMADLDELRGSGRTGTCLNDFRAEAAPAALAEIFAEVTAERFPGDLAVPAVEPVLTYLESLRPLTRAEREEAAARVRERIDAEGTFRIRKHTVLLTARRP